MGENKMAYSILVGKPEEKKPLGRNKPAWEDIFIIYGLFDDVSSS
jgi:hypothetical protein